MVGCSKKHGGSHQGLILAKLREAKRQIDKIPGGMIETTHSDADGSSAAVKKEGIWIKVGKGNSAIPS